MEFGPVLRRMRRVADISQEEMAEKLHISRSNISRLENDKLDLKAADLIKWCNITNNPDVMMAFIYGTDVVTSLISTGASQLITGAILFLGGLL
ncbi:helix-turn-helix domain-containing protein [Lentibacillus sp. Marseille-P4043]|uniref:helix-turn-helix domain-containing protein n=1 Tax=Lentibacillus sp. Marseille-P4043 TaxID=2040293 RepID=UPI000D0AF046|nr:helix-turn-helix transcriptional regulator [Lentibacillus sp. Marseille-P4043]